MLKRSDYYHLSFSVEAESSNNKLDLFLQASCKKKLHLLLKKVLKKVSVSMCVRECVFKWNKRKLKL